MKKLVLLLIFLPQLFYSQWTQLGLDIDGEFPIDRSGVSVSMNATGDRVAIGAYVNDGNGTESGHVRIYEFDGIAWVQLGLDIDGEANGDESGSVSMNANGDRVAIGAYGNDGNGNNSGHVRIYEFDGVAWVQLGLDIDGEAADDRSGSSVSMNATGDRVAIGAHDNDGNGNNSGHVRIYEWSGTAWVQLGLDIDAETGIDWSGWSVSMNANGDKVAIGAPLNDGNGNNSGHVRIYEWSGTAWVQLGLDIDGEANGDESGWSVSMNANGDKVAIGAHDNDGNGNNSGHVRIYEWSGTSWVQLGLDIDGEAAGDQSGSSVSMNANGDKVAIGASGNDGNGNNSGHVRIYEFDGVAWVQLGLDIDGEAADDRSSVSVPMNANGDRVAIGAGGNDGNGTESGHVRVYYWCQTSGTDTQVACNSYNWIDGNTYTSNNTTATHVLTNAAGCDSIVTLNLTIDTVDNGITNNSPTLSANASIGTYQWLDCDNNFSPIIGENNQIYTATFNGNYAVAVTQNGCTDTSACETVNNVGINEINSNISLHPNPTHNQIIIDIKGYNGPVEVELYDLSGRLLQTTNTTTISLKKYSKGIYVFKVSYGEITQEVRVVKD